MNTEEKNTEVWINPEKLKQQQTFIDKSREIGRSDNLYGRMDLDEQNPRREVKNHSAELSSSQVIEALKRSPEIDASRITVRIRGSQVTLQGEAGNLKEVRGMISVVKNLPGVGEVKNEIITDDSEPIH